ncbi:hepatic lectin-like isoform X1 [Podarcis muralis]|uniref:Hepatic lectin-like n=1 Tax=Podarcis muralis TaxID=64176 RepID=A0A670IG74_PODMU|nr:hepatic lectin-like [Podarcis muralis]
MGIVGDHEQVEDGDHGYLAKMGKAMAPRKTGRSFPQWKWSSSFLVYGLLALAYLLMIILLGLLISSGSKFFSEMNDMHKQLEMSKELFPCGSRSREWEYFDGRCYYFSVQKFTWHIAESQCAQRNSSLVVIHDEAKQNFLESQTRNERYWIGLNDIDEEGEWRWIDGTNYLSSYKNWRQGQPSDYQNKEDCAEIHFSGEWNDESCSTANFYICEKPLPS